MGITTLSPASALNPGSDLWILPELDSSPWTARLDWYLNFQVSKASRHRSPRLPGTLSEILHVTELDAPTINAEMGSPLMIPSQEILPNKWVVLLPGSQKIQSWSQQALTIWKQLGSPSLRIFLPPGHSTRSFQEPWLSFQDDVDMTVVLD